MFAPMLLTAIVTIFCIIVAWNDIKNREYSTLPGIIVLIFIAVMSTISMWEQKLPFAMIVGESLIISSIFTAITIFVSGMEFDKTTISYTMGIFAPVLYTFFTLLKTTNPFIPLILFTFPLMAWTIPKQLIRTLVSSNPLVKIIWTAIYIALIITSSAFLIKYLGDSTLTRALILLNFTTPVGIQFRQLSIGNGDIMLIWLITAICLYLEMDPTAGFGVILYAVLLMFIFTPFRVYYNLKKHDCEIIKPFIKSTVSLYSSVIIGMIISYNLIQKIILSHLIQNTEITTKIGLITMIGILMFVTTLLLRKKISKPFDRMITVSIKIATISIIGYLILPLNWFIGLTAIYITRYITTSPQDIVKSKKHESIEIIVLSIIIGTFIFTIEDVLFTVYNNNMSILTMPAMLIMFSVMIEYSLSFMKIIEHIVKTDMDNISKRIENIKTLKNEPFAVELTLAFILVCVFGSPGYLIGHTILGF
ncbi:TspO/MBR family protein [uncultured Methanomethylovorans sp.]|uniref:TspO/MBR family protein n=1 Tax=uncultured Methanomethylovorans sp. TaxID=183759 RepID=UPI002AA90CE6|nr:TspO/MBR family protein [uncultured Methanomethylovorans sp.]